MKRVYLFLIAILMLPITGALAQNLQIHYDFTSDRNYVTTTFEMFKPDDWGSTFMFIDYDYSNSSSASLTYMEIERDTKIINEDICS